MATVVALAVADPASVWTDLGFAVDGGSCQVGSVRIDLVGSDGGAGGAGEGGAGEGGAGEGGAGEGGAGEGVVSWGLSGVALDGGRLDGLPTEVVDPVDGGTAPPLDHPNGVVAIDHVVVSTPDLQRTIAAFDEAGLLLRRQRDAGPTYGTALRQAFFRLGEVIVEVVGPAEPPPSQSTGESRFFGLAFTVADLASTSSVLGGRLSPTKDAVQSGRTIATLSRDAGSTVAMAFMSPEPRRPPA